MRPMESPDLVLRRLWPTRSIRQVASPVACQPTLGTMASTSTTPTPHTAPAPATRDMCFARTSRYPRRHRHHCRRRRRHPRHRRPRRRRPRRRSSRRRRACPRPPRRSLLTIDATRASNSPRPPTRAPSPGMPPLSRWRAARSLRPSLHPFRAPSPHPHRSRDAPPCSLAFTHAPLPSFPQAALDSSRALNGWTNGYTAGSQDYSNYVRGCRTSGYSSSIGFILWEFNTHESGCEGACSSYLVRNSSR